MLTQQIGIIKLMLPQMIICYTKGSHSPHQMTHLDEKIPSTGSTRVTQSNYVILIQGTCYALVHLNLGKNHMGDEAGKSQRCVNLSGGTGKSRKKGQGKHSLQFETALSDLDLKG